MYGDDLFHSPAGRIAAFAQMQLHRYRHDVSPQDYFEPLQLDTLTSPRAHSREQRAPSRVIGWAIHGADKASQVHRRKKIKTDVLFCADPDLGRNEETQLLSALFSGSRRQMPRFFVCDETTRLAAMNWMLNWRL
jgi:hypothetical protein